MTVPSNLVPIPISQLPLVTQVAGTSTIMIVQNGATYRTTLASIPLAFSVRIVLVADGRTITPNCDTTDIAEQFNTQTLGSLTVAAPTGTPTDCQRLMIRLRSNAVQTFTWNAAYQGSTDIALPSATSGAGKYDYVQFMYNSTAAKWQLVQKVFGF
jgi:hypothetical protein